MLLYFSVDFRRYKIKVGIDIYFDVYYNSYMYPHFI